MTTRNSGEHSQDVRIRHEFRSGDAGRLIELHGLLYSQEYGFDHTFEAYVAKPLADFMLRRSPRERIWLVDCDGSSYGVNRNRAILRDSSSVALVSTASYAAGERSGRTTYRGRASLLQREDTRGFSSGR
jgi:hypothetical protein